MRTAILGHFGSNLAPGVLRKGHRVSVTADTTQQPPIRAAEYAALEDSPVAVGQVSATIRVRATRVGSDANRPAVVGGVVPTITSTDKLFDTFTSVSLEAAGGSFGQSDAALKRATGASWSGRWGPNSPAYLAGALADAGAARAVVRKDQTKGIALVYPVDESWAQSTSWLEYVGQQIRTRREGVGCRSSVERVDNQRIRVSLTVLLRDSRDLVRTAPIVTAIERSVRAYFDDRRDWYIWRTKALRSAAEAADRRILSCTSANVLDQDDMPLAEPTTPAELVGTTLTHYWLLDSPLTITFLGPA